MRTITKTAGESFRYQLGDEIEYWQEPTQKATSGWTGTGVICDLTRLEHGVIGVRTSSDRVSTRMIKQVRPVLAYWGLFREGPDEPAFRAVQLLAHLVGQRARGLQLTLGQVRQEGQWITTRETRTHDELWDAARAVAELHLQLTTVLAARISTGTKELKARDELSSSFLIWWTPQRPASWQTLDSTSTGADLNSSWYGMATCQCHPVLDGHRGRCARSRTNGWNSPADRLCCGA